MTYSIGFRAPNHQELAEQFLVYKQDRVSLNGMYADPGLKVQKHPSEISPDMLHQVEKIVQQVQWGKRDIADFLGCYLSEPKSHIFFEPPARPYSRMRFEQAAKTRGLALVLQSQMLCHNSTVFINGTAHTVGKDSYRTLRSLADERQIVPAPELTPETLALLYQWYTDGYIMLVSNSRKPLTS